MAFKNAEHSCHLPDGDILRSRMSIKNAEHSCPLLGGDIPHSGMSIKNAEHSCHLLGGGRRLGLTKGHDGTKYKIMPELSRFLGVIIYMYFNDHNPPHFHVVYGEYEASISITGLGVLEGEVPARVLGYVVEWASMHKQALMNNWNMLQSTGTYCKIPPLV